MGIICRKIIDEFPKQKITFKVVKNSSELNKETDKKIFALLQSDWDNYHYKTSFKLIYVEETGKTINLEALRIIKKDMSIGNVEIPNTFNNLSDEYCSLGSSQTYDEKLMRIPENTRHNLLTAIRDCVFNQNIFDNFETEIVMQQSLLRANTRIQVKEDLVNRIQY